MNTVYVPCGCESCTRTALRVVNETVYVKVRHDGETHETAIALSYLLRLAGMVVDKCETVAVDSR